MTELVCRSKFLATCNTNNWKGNVTDNPPKTDFVTKSAVGVSLVIQTENIMRKCGRAWYIGSALHGCAQCERAQGGTVNWGYFLVVNNYLLQATIGEKTPFIPIVLYSLNSSIHSKPDAWVNILKRPFDKSFKEYLSNTTLEHCQYGWDAHKKYTIHHMLHILTAAETVQH